MTKQVADWEVEKWERHKVREQREIDQERARVSLARWIAWRAGVGALLLLILAMWGCPKYKIYRLDLNGRATLAEAEWDRKVAVEEAKARVASAEHDKEAEIVRAQGVAEANQIIGDSLQGNEAYLRYLWIQGLHDGTSELIYVPTEANLPILEAGRYTIEESRRVESE